MQILHCTHLAVEGYKSHAAGEPERCSISGIATKLKNLVPRQVVRIMKLTAIILLVACLQVQATGYGQKLTLALKDAPVEKLFNEIRVQTGYEFLYINKSLENARNVTIQVKDASLETVLQTCFKDQPFNYKIKERVIIITPKTQDVSVAPNTSTDPLSPPVPQSVRGKIVNENGEPVVATVSVKGKKIATTTNDDGEFYLQEVDGDATLVITGVGLETREIKINSKTDLFITVKIALAPLEEAVIKGYYTTTRKFNTGNVSTVKSVDIEKNSINNPLQALQGRVPGMIITQRSGVTGGAFDVQIRGRNSINSGNSPLYVIDGVPFSSSLLSAQGFTIIGSGNALNYLNPTDIESIDILKDADATAIYGSRGANGVVLITTKKGKSGRMKLDLNINSGIGKVSKKLDLLNLEEYLIMRREAFRNDGVPIGPTAYSVNGQWDTTRSTDWQKKLIGNTARHTNTYVGISGGSSNIQYLIGGSYFKQTTVFPGRFDNQKGSIHINLNSSSTNQRLHISLAANYINDNNTLPTVDLTQYIFLPPNAPAIYDSVGKLNWQNSTWTNPFAVTLRKYKAVTTNLIASSNLSYKILKGLELKANIGYTNFQANTNTTNPGSAMNPAFAINRTANFVSNNTKSWIFESQLNYNTTLGKNKLNGLLGGTLLNNWSGGKVIFASGYPSDALLESVVGAPTISVSDNGNMQYKYAAIFGRVNYNYNNTFLVNITGRNDASSRFGPGQQSHFFSAIGLGWVFSNTKVVKKELKLLSFGKFRFSYGTSGNDQIGDYGYLDLFRYVENLNPYQNTQGVEPNSLFNPDFSWEVNKKMEGGVDIGILKDKIYLSLSYFNNRSTNQLIGYSLPGTTGFNSILANRNALVQNSGWEVLLNTTNIKNQALSWTSSFNITFSRNKLIDYPNLQTSPDANFLVISKPLSVIKAYDFIGVEPQTGVYQFSDKNGNATSNPSFSSDRILYIDPTPKFYGGLHNTFRYKNISLDFLFQFIKQIGYDALLFTNSAPGRLNTYNPSTRVMGRWQKPGDEPEIQKFTQSSNSQASLAHSFAASSDAAFVDASFIRLKNLSFSFAFPGTIIRKIGFSNFRIYVQGQNLITITKYTGFDPENQSTSALPPSDFLRWEFRLDFNNLQKNNIMNSFNAYLSIRTSAFLFISYFLLFGCRKLVEIDPPINRLVRENVFQDDATASSVLTGIYQKMNREGFATGSQSFSVAGGLTSDELVNFDVNVTSLHDFYTNNIKPENLNILSLWNQLYNYIYTANTVLEGLSASDKISIPTKLQLEGEAKFIRAFCNFYLINIWGDVPLVLSSDYNENAVISKNQVENIYEQIVKDLLDAKELLSDNYKTALGGNTMERVRPNKFVVSALLSRVYLFRNDWINAELQATSVIDNKAIYDTVSLNSVFLRNSKEAIWQLQSVVPNYNTLDAYLFVLTSGPNGGANPVYLSNNLINAFESGDKRSVNWVGTYNGYKYPFKYKVRNGSNITEYLTLLRLSEQYLIRSEARARQNNISGALYDLNVIRKRAGLQNCTANDLVTLMMNIERERQVELFTEFGHRWLDLKRTGRATSIMQTVTSQKGGSWDDKWQLYPLPRIELQRNSNLAPQNPGYPD